MTRLQGLSRWCGRAVWLAVLVLGETGCSLDGLLKQDELPPNVTDPAVTKTPEGALAAYRGTLGLFREAFGSGSVGELSFVPVSGLFSDELRAGVALGSGRTVFPEDQRNFLTTYTSGVFRTLQKVRGQAGQAAALLKHYASLEQQPLVGHSYALAGYAEVLLAELYCSGIPLSTVDFDGDYTLEPGSSTAQVLRHAVALFDTALALTGDSARFTELAAVGKARALLGLGEYGAAAAAGSTVLDDYRYEVSYSASGTDANFSYNPNSGLWQYSIADREGGNGLPYATSADPRIGVMLEGTNNFGYAVYRPVMYAADGASPIVLASGVEARLVEAEAALQMGDTVAWLAKLNHLRQTAWPTIRPAVTTALPDTTDPGTDEERVDLLFHERAFWLFLTGHRQGDLRRLIRQYHRPQLEVYPVGVYPGVVGASYGFDVTVPIPQDERVLNPQFTGCISPGA